MFIEQDDNSLASKSDKGTNYKYVHTPVRVCKDMLHCHWIHKITTSLDDKSMAVKYCSHRPSLRCRSSITRELDPKLLGDISMLITGAEPISPVEPQKRMNHWRPEFVKEFEAMRDEIFVCE